MSKKDSEFFMTENGGLNEFFVTPDIKADFDRNGYVHLLTKSLIIYLIFKVL